jgi:hypothetical protein
MMNKDCVGTQGIFDRIERGELDFIWPVETFGFSVDLTLPLVPAFGALEETSFERLEWFNDCSVPCDEMTVVVGETNEEFQFVQILGKAHGSDSGDLIFSCRQPEAIDDVTQYLERMISKIALLRRKCQSSARELGEHSPEVL